MLESIKKVDKKILMMMGVVIGIVLLLIIAVIVVSLTTGGKLSYSQIENKMVSSAKKYAKTNDSILPTKKGEIKEISVTDLVSGGYLKDLSEFTGDDVVCSGSVIIAKTEKDYDYVANLDCGSAYKTVFLADKLKENIVTSGNGLYKMEDVVRTGTMLGTDDDGYDLSSNELMSGYIYRGEIVNNYIKLDGDLYRIVKIDGNDDITVVATNLKVKSSFDDRYNKEIDKEHGINDYAMSRAYERISTVYDSLKDDSVIKTKGAPKNICIGARSDDDDATDGSIECSKVMKGEYYSLIPLYDLMNASLSEGCVQSNSRECTNYNYLIDGKTAFWSMTATNENTYATYLISNTIEATRSNRSTVMKYVYYLSKRLIYTGGSGTESDPYIVK